MSLSNILVPNQEVLYAPTMFDPGFSADANNTYTNLGSTYQLSNDGQQVQFSYKFRVLGTGAGAIATTVTLPVNANSSLVNLAVFPPTPLVVSSTGASTLTVQNAPAGNTAQVLSLTSTGGNTAAVPYTVEIIGKYMLVAANN